MRQLEKIKYLVVGMHCTGDYQQDLFHGLFCHLVWMSFGLVTPLIFLDLLCQVLHRL